MKCIVKKVLSLSLVAVFLFTHALSVAAIDNWPIETGTTKLNYFNPTTVSNNVFLKHELLLSNIGNPKLLNGDTLYTIGTNATKLHAVSLDSKVILWEFTPDASEDIRSLALVNGNVAVLTYNNIYLLKDNGNDKELLWKQEVGGNHISYDIDTIYTASRNVINAIDIKDGMVKWSYVLPNTPPTAEELHSTIIPNGTKIYFSSHSLQQSVTKIYALSKDKGVVQWTTNVNYYSQQPIIAGGKIIVRSINEIFAYHAETGVYLWRKALGSSFSASFGKEFSADETTLFTRTQAGDLIAFNLENGNVLFKQSFGEYRFGNLSTSTRGPALVTNNEVILENSKKLKFFHARTGEPTRVIAYGEIGLEPLLVTDKYLLAKTSDGKLFAYAPPSDEQYVDPNGDGDLETPPSPNPNENEYFYVVQSEDALWKIAQKHDVSIQWIIDRNQLDPNAFLWIGQNLILPKQYRIHIVQSGDALWKIAQNYNVTIQSIVNMNKLDPNKYLTIGQRLIIPYPEKIHVVQSGDTLWRIAQSYNVSIQAIVDKNNLDINQYLWVGQKLIIP